MGARTNRWVVPRITWAIALAAFAFLVLTYGAKTRPVTSIIEERVAITAREMWRAGEWVLPTLNGALRLEKPPLAYWLPQITANAFGRFDELTLRLPFACLTVGTVLFTLGIARRALGDAGGFLAALCLLGAAFLIHAGRNAGADSALLFSTTGAWYFYDLARRAAGGENLRWRRWGAVLCYAFLGLGALAKGPVVLALVILPILVEAIASRSLVPLRPLASVGGVVLFLGMGLTWPLLVIIRLSEGSSGGGALHQWILESFGKMLPSRGVEDGYKYMRHSGPWYEALTELPTVFGFWTVALPLLAYRPCRALLARRRAAAALEPAAASAERGPLPRYVTSWFWTVLVFFTCVAEKKATYLMPLLPPAAILISDAIVHLFSAEQRYLAKAARFVGIPAAALCTIAAVVLFFLPAETLVRWIHPQNAWWTDELGRLDLVRWNLLLFGGITLSAALIFRQRASLGDAVGAFAGVAVAVALSVIPLSNTELVLRPEMTRVRADTLAARALLREDRPVYAVARNVSDLPGGMLFVLDRLVHFVNSLEDLEHGSVPEGAAALVPASDPAWTSQEKDAMLAGKGFRLLASVNEPSPLAKHRVMVLEKSP